MVRQTLAEKTGALGIKGTQKSKEEPKQLPIWPEEIRGAPNEVVRSSLFSARIRGERIELKDAEIFVLGNAKITYSGEELRTFDEDIWLQVMHLARLQPLEKRIQFTPYSMIKALGWVKGKNRPSALHYRRLEECLVRLKKANIKVNSERFGIRAYLSLVSDFVINTKEEVWEVVIGDYMKDLYGDTYYTQLEWEQRAQLSPVAKRFHSYFSSHKNPYPVKIESLYKLCNLRLEIKYFRSKLPGYLKELREIGFLDSFSIEGTKVMVKRVS